MIQREINKQTELNSNKRDIYIYIVFFFHEYLLPIITTADM